MSDRFYPDNNQNNENRRISIDDDYIELLSEKEYLSADDSSDSNDIYIGRKKFTNADSTDDVYISKPRKAFSRDIYSDSRSAVNPGQRQQSTQRPMVYNPDANRARTSQNGAVGRVGDRRVSTPTAQGVHGNRTAAKQTPQNANGNRPAAQKPVANTQTYNANKNQAPHVTHSDEISDHEARHGRVSSHKKGGGGKRVLALLLAVIIAIGAFFFLSANSIVGKFNKADKIEHIEEVDSLVSESHVRNILLIGCDNANGGTARSDSIMICSVNKQTGRITVVSILRDTHLDVPGNRESKVNAAYAWGGANLLVQTIEQNFGIKIDDYATVNFEMFTALVDGLGGIEVDVSEDEADYINNRHRYGREEKPETVPSGENVQLTGYQALWFSRIRKLDSDFNRAERQREVISAIVEKVKGQLTPFGIFGLISTAKDVAPYIETTLSTSDFWNLVFGLASCVTKSGANMDKLLVSQQLPFEGTWWYSSEWDGSSISIDLEENRAMLYSLLYENNEAVGSETEETEE